MKQALPLLFLLACSLGTKAQDVYFVNEQNALVSLNPSFAGSNGFIRTQTNYRLTNDMYNTYLSYDMRIKNSGLAITYAHDNIRGGLYKNDVFNVTYAHYFLLADKKIKLIPSLQAGGFVRHLDTKKLSLEDMRSQFGRYAFVPSWDYSPISQKSNFDASAGLMIQSKRFIFGASVHHFTQPDQGLWGVEKLPALFNVHTSYNVITKKDFLFNFSARYIHQQKFNLIKIAVKSLLFKHYLVGVGSEGEYLTLQYGYRHNYFTVSITSAYNINDSRFNRHEIGASYNLRSKDQRKNVVNIENW